MQPARGTLVHMQAEVEVDVQVCVLGSVGVRRDGTEMELGTRLRRLLAGLAVSNRSVVSNDRLVEIVWAGDPPDGAEKTLRSYVTRLRRALGGDDGRIVFREPGYVIDLAADELDSALFDDELDRALQHLRAADAMTAAGVLEGALARWQGPAYAGFSDEDWARPESVRLEERLVEAREALIEARLALGLNEDAAAEAQALVEAEPLRDQPRSSLMRAMYAQGRRAEALRVFSSYRRYLADETGLDPSEEIVALERRMARGDPSLAGGVRPLRGYELGERIGEGAFAVVHRAVQPGIERDVAIKIIRADLADRPDFIRRFEFEARTVARIEHPNVVPLFDYWREPGAAYLVMRLLRGGSVEQALRAGGPYSREQTLRVLDDVGGALETAHRAGVVHRDVRPANLLLDAEGTTYLADFGIALPTAAIDDMPIASPAYAAPEVLRGEAAGIAADVLSLAITTFEMLTGRLPFADSLDRGDLIRRQLSEPLPPVRATRTDLPPAVDDVLARATAKAPTDRHATVTAFVAEMRSALDPAAPATRSAQVALLGPVHNPYLGLHAFDEEDANRFFGREQLVAELLEALERFPVVTVVGPSGSGKSSVVRAGVLPAIRRGALAGSDDWFLAAMVPSTTPVDALETALLRVAVNPPATLREQLAEPGGMLRAIRRVLPDERSRLLLVIDQFEELFTQARDPDERDRFLSELATAVTEPNSPLRVIATLRADHYDAPLRHASVADLVTDGTVTVRPMTNEELERAISLPATAVGVEVESALLTDLVAGLTTRPAALPLMQFSLTELFDRRVSDTMLLSTHQELGGLTGALSARADRILDEGGPDDEHEMRRIFGRLVTPGDGTDDTRRRALRSEFGDGERTAWLIDAFVTARLLTTDRDPTTREPTIEVAHEALLRDWPRAATWLGEDRDLRRTVGTIGAAADAWDRGGRQPSDLYRGGRLESALDVANTNTDWFRPVDHEFLAASRAQTDTDRQLEQRRVRRLRRLVAGTAAALVIALIAGGIAFTQLQRARDEAASAERARGRALAVSAVDQLSEDRSLALLLALEAGRLDDSVVAQGSLLAGLGGGEPFTRTLIPTPAQDYSAIAVAGDGSVAVAKRGDGALDVVDLVRREVRHGGLPSPSRISGGLTLHPDGTFVASAGVATDGTAAVVIDIVSGEQIVTIDGVVGEFYEARFDPDGRRLVVGGPDGGIRVYDTETWAEDAAHVLDEDRTVLTMEFLDSTTLIASATPLVGQEPQATATFTVFDVESGEITVGPVDSGVEFATTLAVVPEFGVMVAAANERLQAYLLEDLSALDDPFGSSEFGYTGITMSPQGLLVAVGPLNFDVFAIGDDGPEQIPTTGSSAYGGAAFVASGEMLIGADLEGSIATILPGWVDDLGRVLEPAGAGAVTVSPDGGTLAVWGRMRGVQLFDAVTFEHRGELPIGPDRSFVGFGFDPSGERAVTLTCEFGDNGPGDACLATLETWDVSTRSALAGPIDAGEVWAGMFAGVTFASGGELVATAQHRGGVQLWDAETLAPAGPPLSLQDVAPFPGDQTRIVASAEADGRSFLIANAELSEAVVWELTDGAREPVGVIAGVSDVGVTSFGQLMAAQGITTFELFDPSTLEPIGAPFVGGDVAPVHLADSGGDIVVVSGFEGAQLWDVETRQPASGAFAAWHAALARDGSHLVLGAAAVPGVPGGSEVRVLALDTDELRTEACARAGRNLTAAEWALYMPADSQYAPTCPQWPDIGS